MRGAGLRTTLDGSGEHAPGVRVDDGMPVAVREDRHRARGVVADAGEGEQGVDVAGDDAVVAVADLHRRPVQPEGAARVSEVRPLGHGVARGRGGEVGRGGPAGQPGLEVRDDAGDGGLLQHELAHQRAPRSEPGTPPRQVARCVAIPVDERSGESWHPSSLRSRTRGGALRGGPVRARISRRGAEGHPEGERRRGGRVSVGESRLEAWRRPRTPSPICSGACAT